MKDDLILRLKKEKASLDSKLFTLHTFLECDNALTLVGEYQFNMMYMQLDVMRIYSGILYLRLKDLEGKQDES